MRVKIIVGVVVTLLFAGAALVLAYGFIFSPASDDAVTLVPKDAVGYFNVFLSPSKSQQQALDNLIQKTPLESSDELIEKIGELIDQGLEGTGCTFKEDIEPWAGKQVAGFLSEVGPEVQGAGLIATDDGDATMEFFTECTTGEAPDFEDRSYNGVDYRFADDIALGLVEGYFVVGTEGAFKEVVDTAESGDSLEDSDKYKDAIDDLTTDNVMLLYADVKAMLEQAQGEIDPADLAAFQGFIDTASDRPVTVALSARDDGIVFEYAQGLPESQELVDLAESSSTLELLPQLPGGAWGAIGIGNVGEFVQGLLTSYSSLGIPGLDRAMLEERFEQETGLSLNEDLLSWMGDLGIFVQGTSVPTLSGGVVIETTDAEASQLAVAELEDYASKQGAPVGPLTIPGVEGFSIKEELQPQPINIAAGAERVVIAYGDLATEQALEADVTLEENDTFVAAQDALGEGFTVLGYFEADPIQQLIEDALLPQMTAADPDAQANYEEDAKPFVDPMSFLVFGSNIDDGRSVTKIVLGVE